MKVHKEMFERWDKYATLFLAERGYTKDNVKTKMSAWYVANLIDIPKEAYRIGLNDNHIETALKRIFPQAWA